MKNRVGPVFSGLIQLSIRPCRRLTTAASAKTVRITATVMHPRRMTSIWMTRKITTVGPDPDQNVIGPTESLQILCMSIGSRLPLSHNIGMPPAMPARPFRKGLLLIGLLAALAWHPSHGLNIQLCPIMDALGVPCPGCGLTRSMSCSLRGLWTEAWQYHPWGPVFLAYLMGAIIVCLVPLDSRIGQAFAVVRRLRVTHVACCAGTAGFVAFGIARAVWAAHSH